MNADGRILVLCYGNSAREDDGLGPACAELLTDLDLPDLQVESDLQLMVEDSATIAAARLVIFVDASVAGVAPFTFDQVDARPNDGYLTHSIEPDRLLGLTQETFGRRPPAYLLAIRGYSYRMFTEGLTESAQANLQAAFDHLVAFLESENAEIDTHRFAESSPANAPQEAAHERR